MSTVLVLIPAIAGFGIIPAFDVWLAQLLYMRLARRPAMRDSQEMWQSRSTAFSRHQKNERWGTNSSKTIATYETNDSNTKKNCNRGTALERPEEKLLGSLNQLNSRETLLMLLQITNTWSVRIGVLCLICETSQWNTNNLKYFDWSHNTRKLQKQDQDGPDHRQWQQTMITRQQIETLYKKRTHWK